MRFYASAYEKDDDGVWTLPDWEDSARQYQRHMREIWPRLPASVQELIKYAEIHSFHDWEIEKWGHDKGNASVFLQFFYCGRLEFDGVQEIEMPPRDDGSMWAWIVEEFDLADDGLFELRVFTEDGELRVVAKEVRMVGFAVYDKCSCTFCEKESTVETVAHVANPRRANERIWLRPD